VILAELRGDPEVTVGRRSISPAVIRTAVSIALLAVMLVADAVVFGFGYAWLVTVLSGMKGVEPTTVMGAAFEGAIKPFVVWDILKMAFAALSVAGAWTIARRRA
jgi:biotin transport system substrate-specific component